MTEASSKRGKHNYRARSFISTMSSKYYCSISTHSWSIPRCNVLICSRRRRWDERRTPLYPFTFAVKYLFCYIFFFSVVRTRLEQKKFSPWRSPVDPALITLSVLRISDCPVGGREIYTPFPDQTQLSIDWYAVLDKVFIFLQWDDGGQSVQHIKGRGDWTTWGFGTVIPN